MCACIVLFRYSSSPHQEPPIRGRALAWHSPALLSLSGALGKYLRLHNARLALRFHMRDSCMCAVLPGTCPEFQSCILKSYTIIILILVPLALLLAFKRCSKFNTVGLQGGKPRETRGCHPFAQADTHSMRSVHRLLPGRYGDKGGRRNGPHLTL